MLYLRFPCVSPLSGGAAPRSFSRAVAGTIAISLALLLGCLAFGQPVSIGGTDQKQDPVGGIGFSSDCSINLVRPQNNEQLVRTSVRFRIETSTNPSERVAVAVTLKVSLSSGVVLREETFLTFSNTWEVRALQLTQPYDNLRIELSADFLDGSGRSCSIGPRPFSIARNRAQILLPREGNVIGPAVQPFVSYGGFMQSGTGVHGVLVPKGFDCDGNGSPDFTSSPTPADLTAIKNAILRSCAAALGENIGTPGKGIHFPDSGSGDIWAPCLRGLDVGLANGAFRNVPSQPFWLVVWTYYSPAGDAFAPERIEAWEVLAIVLDVQQPKFQRSRTDPRPPTFSDCPPDKDPTSEDPADWPVYPPAGKMKVLFTAWDEHGFEGSPWKLLEWKVEFPGLNCGDKAPGNSFPPYQWPFPPVEVPEPLPDQCDIDRSTLGSGLYTVTLRATDYVPQFGFPWSEQDPPLPSVFEPNDPPLSLDCFTAPNPAFLGMGFIIDAEPPTCEITWPNKPCLNANDRQNGDLKVCFVLRDDVSAFIRYHLVVRRTDNNAVVAECRGEARNGEQTCCSLLDTVPQCVELEAVLTYQDQVGNPGAPCTRRFRVDLQPPTCTITYPSPPKDCLNANDPLEVRFVLQDNCPGDIKYVAVVRRKDTGEEVARCEGVAPQGQEVTCPLPPGVPQCVPLIVEVTPEDGCICSNGRGNIGVPCTREFRVDLEPPTCTITYPSPPKDCLNANDRLEVRFVLQDNCPGPIKYVAVVRRTDTGEEVARCEGVAPPGQEVTCPLPPDVPQCVPLIFEVTPEDGCICSNGRGNIGVPCTREFRVDLEPPTCTITYPSPPKDCLNANDRLEVRFVLEDNCPGPIKYVAVVRRKDTGEEVARCEGVAPQGQEVTCPLPPGVPQCVPLIVEVTPEDGCICSNGRGNIGVPCTREFRVDLEPPTCTITYPSPLKDCLNANDPLEVRFVLGDICLGPIKYVAVVRRTDTGEEVARCEGVAPPGQEVTCPLPPGVPQCVPLIVEVTPEDGCICSNGRGNIGVPCTREFRVDLEPPWCVWLEPKGSCLDSSSITAKFCVYDKCKGRVFVSEVRLDGQKIDWPGVPGYFDDGQCSSMELPPLPHGSHLLELIGLTDECGNYVERGCEITFVVGPCDGPCDGCWGDVLKNVIRSNFKSPDPWDNVNKDTFRPGYINLDGITLRDILRKNSVTIDENLIIQQATYWKCTPQRKCAVFVFGPGSGLNTYDPGPPGSLVRNRGPATNADLDESALRKALRLPKSPDGWYMGNRSILFSPPCTTYELGVVYVVRDPVTGRTSEPKTAVWRWVLESPFNILRDTRDRAKATEVILRNIEYFSTVALGRTQKPKITPSVADSLREALNIPDPTEALTTFETIIGLTSVDFYTFIGPDGKRDVRFHHNYIIESDEEPVGCLLIEQAADLFWRQE